MSPAAGERTTAAGPGPPGRSGPSGQADRAERLADYLDRARGGETGALHQVVRELTPLLWHVARTQGLSSEQAADVVQSTWLELLRRLHEDPLTACADCLAGQHDPARGLADPAAGAPDRRG